MRSVLLFVTRHLKAAASDLGMCYCLDADLTSWELCGLQLMLSALEPGLDVAPQETCSHLLALQQGSDTLGKPLGQAGFVPWTTMEGVREWGKWRSETGHAVGIWVQLEAKGHLQQASTLMKGLGWTGLEWEGSTPRG